MIRNCPDCTHRNKDNASFCAECRKRLDIEMPPPQPRPNDQQVIFDPKYVPELDRKKFQQDLVQAVADNNFKRANEVLEKIKKLEEDLQNILKLQSGVAEALKRREFATVAVQAQATHEIITKLNDQVPTYPAPSLPYPALVYWDGVLVELRALMQTAYGLGAKEELPDDEVKQLYKSIKEKRREIEIAEAEQDDATKNFNFKKAGKQQEIINASISEFSNVLEQFLQDVHGATMMDAREGVKKTFKDFDRNSDNRLSKDECRELFQDFFLGCWSADELDDLFEAADLDADGCLDYCEFIDWIYGMEEEDVEPPEIINLKFNDDIEVLDAASTAIGDSERNMRARINTGFEYNEHGTGASRQNEPKPISEAEVPNVARAAVDDHERSVGGRNRICFAKKGDTPTSPKKSCRFHDNVEHDVACSAVEGPNQSIRERINKGLEREETPKSPKKEIRFGDNDEEFDVASHAVEGSIRSIRQRVNTGFARETVADIADEFDADRDSAEGPKSSDCLRINSGVDLESNRVFFDKCCLQVSDVAEKLGADSGATDGPTKSVRNKIPTGTVRGSGRGANQHTQDSPKRALAFDDKVAELEVTIEA